jgi:hypothetical protein
LRQQVKGTNTLNGVTNEFVPSCLRACGNNSSLAVLVRLLMRLCLHQKPERDCVRKLPQLKANDSSTTKHPLRYSTKRITDRRSSSPAWAIIVRVFMFPLFRTGFHVKFPLQLLTLLPLSPERKGVCEKYRALLAFLVLPASGGMVRFIAWPMHERALLETQVPEVHELVSRDR